ncbi:hypothetical protein [Verrucomicrobium sp. BvORR106]|uniref:dioxygenase family protein n=1 Tax=Verrucomicrobium sp. BvORR106 TaxID=1403819 RepID=UPI0006914E72|nr:hypothetical protein [Verrucomicrobium sp. BvORR106]
MHLVTSRTLATRRRILAQLAAGGAFSAVSGLFAEALTVTAKLTEGPYYPANTPFNNIPLDKDNDMVLLNDSLTPATGLVTHVAGRVLDRNGNAVRGALVEIWHADHHGEYIQSTTAVRNPKSDPNFAGFGQFLTGKDGAYRFRTIKAGLYRGRTRHIHAAVTLPGEKIRTCTQLFWDEPSYDLNGKLWAQQNDNDGVLRGVRDATQRAALIRKFSKVAGAAGDEESTVWDIVMGSATMEPSYPNTPGGELIVPGEAVGSSKSRWKIAVPAYPGYAYEVYANPTHGTLGYAALPFALTAEGKVDRNITVAEKEGTLTLYVDKPSVKGAYLVGYRVPGANLGTPSGRGMGPGGGRGPGQGQGPGPGPQGAGAERPPGRPGGEVGELLFGNGPF